MILFAPTFVDPVGDFPHRNIDSEFHMLTEGFEVVRKKLGEQRHVSLMNLVVRATALFAADQDDANGKTDEGRALLFEMEDVPKDVRNRRVREKRADDEGEVSGDRSQFPNDPGARLVAAGFPRGQSWALRSLDNFNRAAIIATAKIIKSRS